MRGEMLKRGRANGYEERAMPLWQRLLITVVAMIAASFVVGLIWSALLGFAIPSYLSGMIGGLTALPVWEFLRRVGPKPANAQPQA
jgi:Na+/glutamate symporter